MTTYAVVATCHMRPLPAGLSNPFRPHISPFTTSFQACRYTTPTFYPPPSLHAHDLQSSAVRRRATERAASFNQALGRAPGRAHASRGPDSSAVRAGGGGTSDARIAQTSFDTRITARSAICGHHGACFTVGCACLWSDRKAPGVIGPRAVFNAMR